MFSTIIGMLVTDAYLLYLFDHRAVNAINDAMPFMEFVNKLAYQLIFNNCFEDRMMALRRRQAEDDRLPGGDLLVANTHYLSSMLSCPELINYCNRTGKNIVTCKKDCASDVCPRWRQDVRDENGNIVKYRLRKFTCMMYCVACSDPPNNKYVCFCTPSTGRQCFVSHLRQHSP